MNYLSICSGIEAATVAWHPLGWKPVGFSEIEKFPCAVLAARYPDVPNFGDMTKHDDWKINDTVDLIVGGTPCQDFSIAGLRAGLTGDRGNLSLEFGRIAARLRPRWLLWENVPGVLSSNAGQDFATILGLFSGQVVDVPAGGWSNFGILPGYRNAYGLAWRVLDAQYCRVDGFPNAVPQRRRRVFIVGYIGDWRRAAAVLFEPEGLRRDSPPRREAGEGVAADVAPGLVASGRDVERAGETRGQDPMVAVRQWPADVAPTLNAAFGDKQGLEDQRALNGAGLFVAHSLRGEGFDASEDGTGRGTPLVPVQQVAGTLKSNNGGGGFGSDPSETFIPVQAYRTAGDGCVYDEGDVTAPLTTGTDASANIIAFGAKDYGADALENVSPRLRAGGHSSSHWNGGVMPAVAFDLRGREGGSQIEGPHDTANIRAASGGSSRSYVAQPWAVRRLTPRECERLQGFSDDYTLIEVRGKPAADGPRYKALGNSMAVNCMRWIGTRIQMVEQTMRATA